MKLLAFLVAGLVLVAGGIVFASDGFGSPQPLLTYNQAPQGPAGSVPQANQTVPTLPQQQGSNQSSNGPSPSIAPQTFAPQTSVDPSTIPSRTLPDRGANAGPNLKDASIERDGPLHPIKDLVEDVNDTIDDGGGIYVVQPGAIDQSLKSLNDAKVQVQGMTFFSAEKRARAIAYIDEAIGRLNALKRSLPSS